MKNMVLLGDLDGRGRNLVEWRVSNMKGRLRFVGDNFILIRVSIRESEFEEWIRKLYLIFFSLWNIEIIFNLLSFLIYKESWNINAGITRLTNTFIATLFNFIKRFQNFCKSVRYYHSNTLNKYQ